MEKSSRHSKICGDFGENIVLYYLSKHNFEVSLVDHTGIDIVGFNKDTTNRIGISVKSRTRTLERPNDGLLIDGKNYGKIINSCEFFGCIPWIAFVIDKLHSEINGELYIYLMSVETLLDYYPQFKNENDFTFSMSDDRINKYNNDDKINKIKFEYKMDRWGV